MKLTTLSARRFQTKLKATIQSSGRLGFTDRTAKELQLEKGSRLKFLMDDESKALFLVKMAGEDEDAFDVKLSGSYFYVATKLLFDELGYDYKNRNIMFDLVRKPAMDEETGGETFKMSIRDLPRRAQDDEDVDDDD